MGGSGGGFFREYSPSDLHKKVKEIEQEASEYEFQPKLKAMLDDLLANANSRDVESVNSALETIKDILGDEIESSIELKFGGSVAKHTYVDGLSDVDSLLVLRGGDPADIDPSEIKDKVATHLQKTLTDAQVTSGTIAVTVKYKSGLEIQLIPALRDQTGLHVPAWTGETWSKIQPEAFTRALTNRNDQCGNKLVPTIKLAKAINSTLPKAQQLSGYHIESLAIAAFRGYKGPYTTVAMLPHFFSQIGKRVLDPVKDSTGQSVHVDGYLGASNSAERKVASHVYGRLSKRMESASASQSIAQWNALFDDAF